jgi:hypothetical protein
MCAASGAAMSVEQPSEQGRVYEPNPLTTSEYEEFYRSWRELNGAFKGLSEAALLKPLWVAPGADAFGPLTSKQTEIGDLRA